MNGGKRFISPMTFAIVVFSSSFNLDYIAATSNLFETARTFWWLPVLVATAISLFITWVLAYLPECAKGNDLVEWFNGILGKRVAFIASMLFTGGLLAITAVALSHVVRLTQMILLPGASTESLYLITLLAASMVARQRFPVIIRFTLLITLIAVPIILVSAVLLMFGANTANFRPFIGPDIMSSLAGVWLVLPQFRGMILMLFMAPYALDGGSIRRSTMLSVAAGTLGFTLMITATASVVGTESITLLNPTLVAYQIVEFTATGLERMDFLYIISSLMLGTLLVVRPLFLSSYLAARTMGLRDHSSLALLLAPIAYGLAIYPGNQKDILRFYRVGGWVCWLTGVVLPVLVVLYAILRRRLSRVGEQG